MKIHSPQWLCSLSEAFNANGYHLYLVGGAVRDQLLATKVGEWDLTTEAKPNKVETILYKIGAKNIGTVGKRFGTVTAIFHGEIIEVTTFRGEHYSEDSRKPAVSFGTSLEDDLSRRDFTINAIALDIKQEKIIDPFSGQEGLKQKIIKAVGDPYKRFHEDPLRMLRAIRFAVTLGFAIEEETLKAIAGEKDRFAILSAERIAQELDKLLLSKKPSTGIRLLVETGLINYVLPELIPSIDLEFDPKEHKDIYEHILQVLDQTPPDLQLRWCALLHDIAKPVTRKKIAGEYHFLGHENVGAKMAKEVLRRLKYSNDFISYQSKLVRLHQRIPGYDGSWTDGGVRRFVRDAGETLNDLFIFSEADSTGKNERKLEIYRQRRTELKQRIEKLEQEAEIAKIKSPLDGQELMELFNKPAGPWIKPIKEKLLQMVLDGELKESDKKEAAEIARRLQDVKTSRD